MARLSNGEILVAYREGTDHWRKMDGIVRLVRSRDSGKTWSVPETILQVEGHNYGTSLGMSQLANGTLLLPLIRVHDLKRNPRWISGPMIRSFDNGHTWSNPENPSTDGLQDDWWWNI